MFVGAWWEMETKLPILETIVGSLEMPAGYYLKELGYENPEELRAMRAAEDLADDPRVKQAMADHLSLELVADQIGAMQDAIRQLSELMGLLKGTPSIVQRLKDKAQPARRDKRQPSRYSKYYSKMERKVWSFKTGMWVAVDGVWDEAVRRPYDTYDLEHRLGIR